jgi:hypothetical protein
MGLDMYLEGRRFLWTKERETIKIEGIDIPEGTRVKELVTEVGYWRKANQIHQWFVENIQNNQDDCGEYRVFKEDLEKLLTICKKVLSESVLRKGTVKNGYSFTDEGERKYNYEDGEVIVDSSVAEELLPTTSGFFFGRTDYDESYIYDIENTIRIIERAISLPKGWDIYYSSSW